jgi:hypothetical protein
MADLLGIGADIALVAVAIAGVYYATVSSRLFKGDPVMERVWRLAAIAFMIIVFFSALDIIFNLANSSLMQVYLVRISAVFALAVFVLAMMNLVRWGRSSTEARTQQLPQYPQH